MININIYVLICYNKINLHAFDDLAHPVEEVDYMFAPNDPIGRVIFYWLSEPNDITNIFSFN